MYWAYATETSWVLCWIHTTTGSYSWPTPFKGNEYCWSNLYTYNRREPNPRSSLGRGRGLRRASSIKKGKLGVAESQASSHLWLYCLRVYDLILILYPQEVRLPSPHRSGPHLLKGYIRFLQRKKQLLPLCRNRPKREKEYTRNRPKRKKEYTILKHDL